MECTGRDHRSPATRRYRAIPRFSLRSLWALGSLVAVLLTSGVYVLARNAPRDWALHWTPPRTVVARANLNGSYDVVGTPAGFDVVWTTPANAMRLARLDDAGRRLGPDRRIAGRQAEVAIGRMGGMDMVVWREDLPNGARLRAAVARRGVPIRYLTLASGTAALEHPRAFALNGGVGVVFSWQTRQYDIYLTGVRRNGSPIHPVRLTRAASYAFLPHAVQEPSGNIRLVYFDTCCNGQGFAVRTATYTNTGRPFQRARRLDALPTGIGQTGTPNRWGLDLRRDGRTAWAVWSGSTGIEVARWRDGRAEGGARTVEPGAQPEGLTLIVGKGRREIVWEQPFELGRNLQTLSLDARGMPIAPADRVAFEGATDDTPVGLRVGGRPALLWNATPSNTFSTRIEMSRFSAAALGAPNPWARIGLGLANPLANFFLIVVGALALGALIAMGNIFLAFGLLGIYLLAFRGYHAVEAWWAYTGVLAATLWLLMVALGAPFPPVIILSGIAPASAWVTFGGLVLFVLILTTTMLYRFEDVYRAATMAFMSIYFLAFLQALIIVQAQLARI